jgi:hypothetical protein
LATKLVRTQKSINNNLFSSHQENTTTITMEQLCSSTILDDFKQRQDPILLKYLSILFDGIHGNNDDIQLGTAITKDLRFCTAIENLHKAHNSKYIGLCAQV